MPDKRENPNSPRIYNASYVTGINTRRPLGFPEYVITTPEFEVDACVSSRLNVRPLLGRPVLVVTNGQKYLVVKQFTSASSRVYVGNVRYIVPAFLEPENSRIFRSP